MCRHVRMVSVSTPAVHGGVHVTGDLLWVWTKNLVLVSTRSRTIQAIDCSYVIHSVATISIRHFPYEKYTCVSRVELEQSHVIHIWFTCEPHVNWYTCKNPHVKHMWITCESYVNHMWLFQFHMWFVSHVGFYMCIFRKGLEGRCCCFKLCEMLKNVKKTCVCYIH